MKVDLPEARALRLLERAGQYLRGFDSPTPVETWTGLRPMTPDSLPILGRSTRARNLLYATGHGMLGLNTRTRNRSRKSQNS